MVQDFLAKAKRGECVYMCDVRDAFKALKARVVCVIEPAMGAPARFDLALPDVSGEEESFVREYFYANVYNIISAFGGKRMVLHAAPDDTFAKGLCSSLSSVFQVDAEHKARSGFGKGLNVADRVNAALGYGPFAFETRFEPLPAPMPPPPAGRSDAVSAFKAASRNTKGASLMGMDIGGTDIKIVGIEDGHITLVKEYDWNPSLMTNIEAVINPILLLTRVTRMAMLLRSNGGAAELLSALLDKNASDTEMLGALSAAEAKYGEPPLLDGIGVCFPDVVIDDMIVGGETLKTRGIRERSDDYETEFLRLSALKTMLLEQVRPGGAVRLSNDGSLAAYTAAVEMAHSQSESEVVNGVFAYALGTELGTGWIDEMGEIPQIPLEIYNCIIDLGSYPARKFGVLDARSVNNFNTALSGTLQKYACQSGAYRLALEYFREGAPELYEGLFKDGYVEERGGGVYIVTSPKDMRKALLEHIMRLADEGQPEAERVFREIGRYLAVTWRETETLFNPKAKERVLFGRFVKRERIFKLMCEGAKELCPELRLVAGDGSLAFTPLMTQLNGDPEHTVAQFGQAVGAAHFAASALK